MVVYQHIASRRTHENLHATYIFFFLICFQDLIRILIRGAHEKRIIRNGTVGCDEIFFLEQLLGEGWRLRIGNFHETGGTSGNCRHGFRMDVGLVCKARLPEMHLVIDHTGQQVFVFSINFPCVIFIIDSLTNFQYPLVAYQDIRDGYLAFVYNLNVFNENF